jgi:hypothetical protein
VLGCLIGRTPCYSRGRCRVFPVCVSSHVWEIWLDPRQEVHMLTNEISFTNEKAEFVSYRFRCSSLLNMRPHEGIGQEWDFWG